MLGKSRSGRIPFCTKICVFLSRCQFQKPVSSFFSFCARIWAGVFLIGKTIIGRFSNKESARARICSGATRAGVFFYTEIADLCRLGFIYTEFAGRLRVRGWEEFGWLRLGSDFRYTEIADSWRLDFIYSGDLIGHFLYTSNFDRALM